MTAAAKPWMKFYPQDWRADEKLRLCSLAARGLWIEMLAIMHRSERYGQLLIGGQVPTDTQIAVQVGASPPEVTACLADLESAGVFSRTAKGVIFSRRMARDHRKAETARKNGKNGGNPTLCKEAGNPASDKGVDKGGLKPQRLEARDSDTNVSGAALPLDPVKAIFDLGVAILTEDGRPAKDARSLVGMWRKRMSDPELSALFVKARQKTEPAAWLCKAVSGDEAQQVSFVSHVLNKHRRAA